MPAEIGFARYGRELGEAFDQVDDPPILPMRMTPATEASDGTSTQPMRASAAPTPPVFLHHDV